MSNWLVVVLVTISLIFPFLISYILILKLVENKKWEIKYWIIGTVITAVCLATTLILSCTVPLTVMVLISAFIWGTGMGSWAALINYKIRYKR